ncbi:NAD+ kinase [Carnobacterium iners]|uniref:NAD kinase n=1 Tax=Carnobacterium iners TaxID=1073423 RepID=A0A1X7NP99_9LACT|nr:NAD kinase [Carnobacterium iners]SEK28868.1 NAD+ kinase [Carnobacterium iners]SMH39802.1 NAD+ kinase [Carnobacterium iners]
MRIAIVHNNNEKSLTLVAELKAMLEEKAIQLDNKNPNLVITIGGDGTLLSAFHRYAHLLNKIRFVGVHTGHLGFYTDWRDYELPDLVESLMEDKGESISYPLLDIKVTYQGNKEPSHFLALNESTMKRVDGTMVCDVFVKDELFERFRGDGLCVSTPTGSTGYNKSVGGAIIHPRLEAIQLAEIASINNRVFRTLSSPMIVAPDECIKIRPNATDSFILTIDQLSSSEKNIVELQYLIAKERIHFARYRHTHFWSRVEDAFIGAKNKYEI